MSKIEKVGNIAIGIAMVGFIGLALAWVMLHPAITANPQGMAWDTYRAQNCKVTSYKEGRSIFQADQETYQCTDGVTYSSVPGSVPAAFPGLHPGLIAAAKMRREQNIQSGN